MAAAATIADYHWLVSGDAQRPLSQAADDGMPLHRRLAHLRKSLTTERAHLVLQQIELRARARAKFYHADRLFFTPRGLAQATDQWTASYKARRFPPDATAADLCCGIGGDLMGLSERGDVVGCDRDPVVSLFAAENVRRSPSGHFASFRVNREDVQHVDPQGWAAWHIDPDRRPEDRRTVELAHMSPSCDTIEQLLARNSNAAAKLAPATNPPASWHERAELEWISRGRECRQLVAWFGELADAPGQRRATILDGAGSVTGQFVARPAKPPPPADRILDYVAEPDAAVLAAGLAGNLARKEGLLPLAPEIPYFTSASPTRDRLMTWFQVQSAGPFDQKKIVAALRARDIGAIEIKHRGVPLDPVALQRKWKLKGDRPAVLIITPHKARTVAILSERV